MHLNETKAKEEKFNGIIASGVHTLSIFIKLWIDKGVFGNDIIAGRGMNNIKFIKPVYPGDELYTIVEVINKKRMKKTLVLLQYV